MARLVHGEEPEITLEYEEPDASLKSLKKQEDAAVAGRNQYRLVVVVVGLLCILQVALNVSLRLAPDTQGNSECERNMVLLNNSYNNLTAELDRLQTTYNNLVEEQAQLQQLFDNMTKERMDFLKGFQDCQQTQWVCFSGSAYYISRSMKSWEGSRYYCQQIGADLVIINSKEEQEFARRYRRFTWLGLSDRETEGTWKWVDGTLLNTSYWAIKEPNSKNEQEDCAEIQKPDLEKNWNDESCDSQRFFICEKKLTL